MPSYEELDSPRGMDLPGQKGKPSFFLSGPGASLPLAGGGSKENHNGPPSSPSSPLTTSGFWRAKHHSNNNVRRVRESFDSAGSNMSGGGDVASGASSSSRPTISEPSAGASAGAIDFNLERSKDAARLGSLMVNLKYSHLDSTGDTLLSQRGLIPEEHLVGHAQAHHRITHISSGTRARVLKAKAAIELKYQMIAAYQEPIIIDDDGLGAFSADLAKLSANGDVRTLPSRYNPLQIIRDRTMRLAHAQFHESSPQICYWFIDPSEYVRDFSWRERHLDLLKNGKGKYVYPSLHVSKDHPGRLTTHSRTSSSSKTYAPDELLHRLKQKINQKINQSALETDSSVSKSEHSDNSELSDAIPGSPQLPSDRSRSTSNAKAPRRHSQSPVRAARIERLSSSEKRPDFKSLPVTPKLLMDKSPMGLSPIEAPVPYKSSPSKASKDRQQPIGSSSEQESHEVSEQTSPQTYPKDSSAIRDSTVEEEPVPSSSPLAPDDSDQQILYFETIYYLSMKGYARILQNFDKRLKDEALLNALAKEIDLAAARVTEELSPYSQQFIAERLPTVSHLKSSMLREKSVKLESVLVESDRILGEASTTLNLEIRRLGERISRIENKSTTLKIFGNIGYTLLAWTLITLLWITWVIATVIMAIQKTVKMSFRVVKWLLWC